jgi:hypothetical protein
LGRETGVEPASKIEGYKISQLKQNYLLYCVFHATEAWSQNTESESKTINNHDRFVETEIDGKTPFWPLNYLPSSFSAGKDSNPHLSQVPVLS